jgi:hypothetical protein
MTSTYAPNRRAPRSRGTVTIEPIPDADLTAIYCRKSKKGDRQQITVNRQKRLALDDCAKLGLTVSRIISTSIMARRRGSGTGKGQGGMR